MQHFLKTNAQHWWSLFNREQTSTIRKDDRNFAVGDEVIFMEYDKETERASGASMLGTITHIQEGFGLKDGYVVLSVVLAS